MYLGGYRPFGFLPDPNDCHKLILDPVASQYVRLIFELALQGNRTGTIAKILNEKQIPTPAVYHVSENHVYSEQKAWDLQRSHWTSGMAVLDSYLLFQGSAQDPMFARNRHNEFRAHVGSLILLIFQYMVNHSACPVCAPDF